MLPGMPCVEPRPDPIKSFCAILKQRVKWLQCTHNNMCIFLTVQYLSVHCPCLPQNEPSVPTVCAVRGPVCASHTGHSSKVGNMYIQHCVCMYIHVRICVHVYVCMYLCFHIYCVRCTRTIATTAVGDIVELYPFRLILLFSQLVSNGMF